MDRFVSYFISLIICLTLLGSCERIEGRLDQIEKRMQKLEKSYLDHVVIDHWNKDDIIPSR
jgi:hypothetical protein